MVRTIHAVALALVAASLSASPGCASQRKSPATTRTAEPGRAEYPMIVRIVGRHFAVTASSGPDGVVYSAEGADGSRIVANASLDELRRDHPRVFEQLFPGIATKGAAETARRRDTAEHVGIDDPIPVGHAGHPATDTGARGELLLHADAW